MSGSLRRRAGPSRRLGFRRVPPYHSTPADRSRRGFATSPCEERTRTGGTVETTIVTSGRGGVASK